MNAGVDLLTMLRERELDAAIVEALMPQRLWPAHHERRITA
jgi:hypothetical protein